MLRYGLKCHRLQSIPAWLTFFNPSSNMLGLMNSAFNIPAILWVCVALNGISPTDTHHQHIFHRRSHRSQVRSSMGCLDRMRAYRESPFFFVMCAAE